jgi:hypothetical protein
MKSWALRVMYPSGISNFSGTSGFSVLTNDIEKDNFLHLFPVSSIIHALRPKLLENLGEFRIPI